jgi:hypothetical protein
MILLAHGGTLPHFEPPSGEISPRRKGVKQGALLMLIGAILVMPTSLLTAPLGVRAERLVGAAERALEPQDGSIVAERHGKAVMLHGPVVVAEDGPDDPLEAAAEALVAFGVAGEDAAKNAKKPGSFHVALYDALYDMLDADRLTAYMEKGAIEVAPLAFMRGRTLNHAFVILDEAQNTTPEQMKMFLTRIGFGAKAVVNGDVTQIDLARGRKSGLIEARRILADVRGIAFTEFGAQDVVRHPLVARIIDAYEKHQKEE